MVMINRTSENLTCHWYTLLTHLVSPSIEANHIAESYAKIMGSVKERIAKAQEAYTRQTISSVQERRMGPSLNHEKNFKQVGKRCPQLPSHSFGPFPIIKLVNEATMQLPVSWVINNLFYVPWLKPYIGRPLTKVAEEHQLEVLDKVEVMEPNSTLAHHWKYGLGWRQ